MKLAIAVATAFALSACSYLPSGDTEGEKRIVEDEEITIVKVYISKERAHCQDESGNEVGDTKSQLESNSVRTYSSECGVIIGKQPPTLCGEPTLHINIHGINQNQLSEAESLGYQQMTSITDELGFEIEPCSSD
jgi:hypothetical protein